MLILAAKPVPLVSLVANPFTGNVDIVIGKESLELLGPAYVPVVRQNLEKALKVFEELEVDSVYTEQLQFNEGRDET